MNFYFILFLRVLSVALLIVQTLVIFDFIVLNPLQNRVLWILIITLIISIMCYKKQS